MKSWRMRTRRSMETGSTFSKCLYLCSRHKERYKDFRDWIWLPDRCYRLDMSPQRRYTRKLWTKGSNMKWCMLSDVVGLCLRAGVCAKRSFPVFGARTYHRIRSSILSSANVHCWNSLATEWGSPWLKNLETPLCELHKTSMCGRGLYTTCPFTWDIVKENLRTGRQFSFPMVPRYGSLSGRNRKMRLAIGACSKYPPDRIQARCFCCFSWVSTRVEMGREGQWLCIVYGALGNQFAVPLI